MQPRRTRHRARTGAGVIALLLIGTLAGCGGDPAPVPPPPTPETPTTTPPTPTPFENEPKNAAGATAVTRAFIDALNQANSTGDTHEIRTLYIPFCTRCEAVADAIDSTYANGGAIVGGRWVPTKLKFHVIRGNVAYLDALVDYDAQIWTRTAQSEPLRFKASVGNLHSFNLRWHQTAGWKISALDPNQ